MTKGKTTPEDTTKKPAKKVEAAVADETAATEVKPKAKGKAKKRSVPIGQVHIQATFNNTIVSVTDTKGNVIAFSSAGACGFRGSKKGTAYAAQVAGEKALSTAQQNHGLKKVDIFVKGTGMGREAAMRALHNVDVVVDSITDVTSTPHGGCRPRKARRG